MGPERSRRLEVKAKGIVTINSVTSLENASCLILPAVNESSEFFAKNIKIEAPDAFYRTEERLREIGFTKAEPLILPQLTLRKNDPLWKGRVRPHEWLWKEIHRGKFGQELGILQKGIYLLDGRPKPESQYGVQKYEDDEFLESMIAELRKKGKIGRDPEVPDDSRYGISALEIEEEIMPALARAIGKNALGSEGRVVNTPYIIFNIVGNMRHPEWGRTSTMEWFGDKGYPGYRLAGGSADIGGLADYGIQWARSRFYGIGFRPLIFFPMKVKRKIKQTQVEFFSELK